ncbi:MAG: bifunctional [glutamate--ammonia ligase]-adenylyl-L-tyrosine phosphorylase/[glutamate--ammonia-ligase] adenylyltransferase [Methylococcales bacterium]|nr:bifunctional [glutamate--ammonia ligase]-adenylyl-L-tyrosine phosphorylase/[glutamate--ammonia-ligase] adenylyltransferase [Methylococcales bacterium]
MSLPSLPAELQPLTSHAVTQFEEKLSLANLSLPTHPAIKYSLEKVFCCSQFVTESCHRYPSLLIDLITSEALFSNEHRVNYSTYLAKQCINTENELMHCLRFFRRQEMVRIAWRDLAGWSTLDETLQDLTALAEACIQTALDFLYQEACKRRGIPTLADGTAINIVVLGMGKLGAWELNYSSDIDLIFAYAEEGILNDRKQTRYSEFFSRICRSLVKVLDAITVDGFVFRTDIRLRPFGDSGAIIMTFDGMENYYLTQAREWERYAMIKARQVAGDFESGKQLMALLKPFVYRRYLDYGAFEELRSLKTQITQELQRKKGQDNIKLGYGGIREIEFIGQAFQLIRGGQEVQLQQRGILTILNCLGELNLLSKNNAQALSESYCFLRRIENHIQQYQDKQTHDLPKDPQVQQILAYSLDFSDWADFLAHLNVVREQVQAEFEAVFSVSEQNEKQYSSDLLWLGTATEDDLSSLAFNDIQTVVKGLVDFKQTHAIKRLTTKGLATLERLMPKLINAVVLIKNSDETLKRLLVLFEAVAGRNVYLSLLAENPEALTQLVKLSSASEWVCEYLARYPILFDELLDTRSLYEPLEKEALKQQLQQQLASIDLADEEQVMIALRQFKHLNVLRVAAADIMGKTPLMVVSNYLTLIAETIVDYVINYSWHLLIQKHGFPVNTGEQVAGFAVLGFGKLGGIELGYGSDLDMVFLYACEKGHTLTTGKKPIPNTQFYGRLGQKIRHILDTKMLAGLLYEVDMRLRPSGHSGLLVSNINTYENYFKNEAWTWEHQALVRGRFIAGDANLQTDFLAIRQRILSLPREVSVLKKEVFEMREKMRETLAKENEGQFDIKQSRGGVVDIEFMVQFGVLSHSSAYFELTQNTDNINLIKKLETHHFFTAKQAEVLTSAYCHYRDYGHRQVLQGHKAVTKEAIFTEEREFVGKLWTALMG